MFLGIDFFPPHYRQYFPFFFFFLSDNFWLDVSHCVVIFLSHGFFKSTWNFKNFLKYLRLCSGTELVYLNTLIFEACFYILLRLFRTAFSLRLIFTTPYYWDQIFLRPSLDTLRIRRFSHSGYENANNSWPCVKIVPFIPLCELQQILYVHVLIIT